MVKNFVPFELAVKLKELGFKEECFARWFKVGEEKPIFLYNTVPSNENGDIITIASLWQQAFDFFREKYNILATIYSNASGYCYEWHDAIGGTHRVDSGYNGTNDGGAWDSYNECRIALLNHLIQSVENN